MNIKAYSRTSGLAHVSDVVIEKLVHGGMGLGHYEGKVVFVPFTPLGDVVLAREVRGARDFLDAVIVSFGEWEKILAFRR